MLFVGSLSIFKTRFGVEKVKSVFPTLNIGPTIICDIEELLPMIVHHRRTRGSSEYAFEMILVVYTRTILMWAQIFWVAEYRSGHRFASRFPPWLVSGHNILILLIWWVAGFFDMVI